LVGLGKEKKWVNVGGKGNPISTRKNYNEGKRNQKEKNVGGRGCGRGGLGRGKEVLGVVLGGNDCHLILCN